jgi:hypothetical protein
MEEIDYFKARVPEKTKNIKCPKSHIIIKIPLKMPYHPDFLVML